MAVNVKTVFYVWENQGMVWVSKWFWAVDSQKIFMKVV